tara:strand:- start:595 stop:873 length:279 start_codon:yes stop_codon:yes gene_type:complete
MIVGTSHVRKSWLNVTIDQGIFMSNITNTEVVGHFHKNIIALGHCHSGIFLAVSYQLRMNTSMHAFEEQSEPSKSPSPDRRQRRDENNKLIP